MPELIQPLFDGPIDIVGDVHGEIDAIFQLHVEAGKQKWTPFVDITYLKLTLPIEEGLLQGSVTPNLVIFDFGTFYTLKENFQTAQPWRLQFMAAGRAFKIKNTLRPNRFPSVSASENFVTPMLGLRLVMNLSKRWHLVFRGDFGGFGIDNTRVILRL